MPIPTDFVSANTRMLEAYATISAQFAEQAQGAELTQLTAIMAGVVPPERVSEFFEFGYAKADLLDSAAKEAFADVGAFATVNGFYGLGQNGRGMAMERILRGEPLPDGVEPPEPSTKYAPPTIAPAPIPPAVPQGGQ